MKTYTLPLLGLLLFGCETGPVDGLDETQPTASEPVSADAPAREVPTEAAADCKKTCGIEARGGVYAECLEAGGTQADCGASARHWFVDCLDERCAAEN